MLSRSPGVDSFVVFDGPTVRLKNHGYNYGTDTTLGYARVRGRGRGAGRGRALAAWRRGRFIGSGAVAVGNRGAGLRGGVDG